MFRENCCCMWRVFGINDRHDKAFASESVYVYLTALALGYMSSPKSMKTSYYVLCATRHFSSAVDEANIDLYRALKIQAKRGITRKINENKIQKFMSHRNDSETTETG
uniref:Uncharacterized protein n=1 Tax=Glossina austeni TaxID=7395 RepID=A0A1A9V9T8_GLOAU